MRRAQYALAAILISFLLLYMFYVIYMQSEARKELFKLWENTTNETTNETIEAPAGIKRIPVNKWLRSVEGGTIVFDKLRYRSDHAIDILFKYAVENVTDETREITCNVFSDGEYGFTLEPTEEGVYYRVDFELVNLVGSPIVLILKDGKPVTYLSSASKKFSLLVTKPSKIAVRVMWSGWDFWRVKKAVVHISVKKITEVRVHDKEVISLYIPKEVKDEITHILFRAEFEGTCPLVIKLNNRTLTQSLFEGLFEHEFYVEPYIKEGENKLSIEVREGVTEADCHIKFIDVLPESKKQEKYYLEVKIPVKYKDRALDVYIRVTEVVGSPRMTVYVFGKYSDFYMFSLSEKNVVYFRIPPKMLADDILLRIEVGGSGAVYIKSIDIETKG